MFPVGVTTVVIEDPSRLGEDGAPRTLTTEIWYPAAAAAGEMPRDAYNMLLEAPDDAAARLEGVVFPAQEQDAARDAPIEVRHAPYPLLVFSHGMGGIRFQTFTLMIHLASHGYVVAAPDHTGDLIWDLLVDGFQVGRIPGAALNRPRDVSLVAERVAAADGPLGDNVDPERWGVFGHSFGGLTSILVTAATSEFYDARFDAMLPLAPAASPALALGYGADHSAVPMLVMGGTLDATCPYAEEQIASCYDIAPPPRAIVGVHGAGHFSFTELCELDLASVAAQLDFGEEVQEVVTDGCGPGFIDPAAHRAIQEYFAAAFFNFYLRGSPDAAAALSPDAIPVTLLQHIEYRQEGMAP